MSKARELAELSRTVSDSADATAITINSSEEVTFADDIFLADGKKVVLGAGSDLQIYHDGLHSYIKDAGTGQLRLLAGTNVQIWNADATSLAANFNGDTQTSLYYAGSSKLTTTPSGIDVTGQVKATSDFIAADSGGTARGYLFGTSSGLFARFNSGSNFQVQESGSTKLTVNSTGIDVTGSVTASTLDIQGTAMTERLRLSTNDGTTYWDARRDSSTGHFVISDDGLGDVITVKQNSGSVGIGCSPSRELEVTGAGNVYIKVTAPTLNDSAGIELANTGGTWLIQNDDTSSEALTFDRAGVEVMRIDSGGNVGINRPSPNGLLHIQSDAGSNAQLYVQTGDTSTKSQLIFGDSGDSNTGGVQYDHSDDSLQFHVGNVGEKMRIDSSGNLLVGTTTTAAGNEGLVYFNGNSLRVTRDGNEPLNLDRLTNNGNIIEFRKDGSTVGSIGVEGGDSVYCQGGTTGGAGLLFHGGAEKILPVQNSASIDATIDLGQDSRRFKDLYLSGRARAAGSTGFPAFASVTDTDTGMNPDGAGNIQFTTQGSEAMRIDASQNLLVGTTSTVVGAGGSGVTGFRVDGANGILQVAASGNLPAIFNRTTSDGTIVDFRKDGLTVGSIGVKGGSDLTIGTGDTAFRFIDSVNKIYPATNAGAIQNGVVGLGNSNARFTDLYLSGGVYLGGTGSANKLDEYEEGTWSVTSGVSLTITAAVYTRIGRVVHLVADITFASGSTSGSDAALALPFNNANTYSSGSLNYTTHSGTPSINIEGHFLKFRASVSDSNLSYNNVGGHRFIFHATYFAA